jgi:hypothetical protein
MIDMVWGTWISIDRASGFFILATLVVGILRQASIALIGGLTIFGDTVMVDMEELAPEP